MESACVVKTGRIVLGDRALRSGSKLKVQNTQSAVMFGDPP